MLLGLLDNPFVPHNLISAQGSPVPLPKFQMDPRLKILMSSWSKKGTQIYYHFLSKSPNKRIPSRFHNAALIERDIRLQGISTSLLIYLFIFPSESPIREPPPCSLTGSPWTGILLHHNHWSIYSFNHSFMYVCRSPQKGALLHTYGEKQKVTVHGTPSRRKAGCGLVPQVDC